jgi:DNA-binding Lrp family transcriptional regulator
MISAISSVGPRNVAQIARMTGAHQETIRYKIKKRFGRLGFRFHAVVDFAKLGLELHWGNLNFSRTYRDTASQILRALNRVGYLTYFGRVIPQGNYVTLFALPPNTGLQYEEFLAGLRERGIVTNFSLNEVLVERYKPMNPRFLNFKSGRWEIEWNKLATESPTPLIPGEKPPTEDFDEYDLLIIKELQIDSLQHLTEIARKLKVHQKTIEYHYRMHIQKRELVSSYRIRWAQDITKRLVHSVATTRIAFHGLSRRELTDVQALVSKIPFLWLEDLLQDGTYTAMLYAPLSDLINMSSYLSNTVPDLASRMELGFIDPSQSTSFTIPYNMYQGKEWKFNPRQMEAALRKESIVPLQK